MNETKTAFISPANISLTATKTSKNTKTQIFQTTGNQPCTAI
jgi:hypothetical protein